MRAFECCRGAGGFTYLGVLFAVAFMGIGLALAGQVWSTLDRRDREQQLLFIGAQFRDALMRYYNGAPPGARRQFPLSLDELVRDRRYPDIRRYLRKIYADPLTGNTQWGLIKTADGFIVGVYSRAAGVPIKTDRFDYGFQLVNKKSYAEWIFGQGDTGAGAAGGQSPALNAGGSQSLSDLPPPVVKSAANDASAEHTETCGVLAANDKGACIYAARIHGPQVGAACQVTTATRYAECLNFQPFSQLVIR